MSAIQIHLNHQRPAPEPVSVSGWRPVKEPLSGWRDDDPDALPRCAVNPEHTIKNGDHYAVAGIQMACLPCARLAPPKPVEPWVPKPAPIPNTAARRFGGLGERKNPPWKPAVRTAAPAPAPARRQVVRPEPDRRTCAREGCLETFEVKNRKPDQRYCSVRCGAIGNWASRERPAPADAICETAPVELPRRLSASPEPPRAVPTKRTATREERTRTCQGCSNLFVVDRLASPQRLCGPACRPRHSRPKEPSQQAASAPIACATCGQSFTPDSRHRHTCSWACETRGAAGHSVSGCACLGCADRRAEVGMAPLPVAIGSHTVPSFRSDRGRP